MLVSVNTEYNKFCLWGLVPLHITPRMSFLSYWSSRMQRSFCQIGINARCGTPHRIEQQTIKHISSKQNLSRLKCDSSTVCRTDPTILKYFSSKMLARFLDQWGVKTLRMWSFYTLHKADIGQSEVLLLKLRSWFSPWLSLRADHYGSDWSLVAPVGTGTPRWPSGQWGHLLQLL